MGDASVTFQLSARSRKRLVGVHPALADVVDLALGYSIYDFAVSEGLRDIERQRMLVATGFSQTLESKHLPQPDGFAHAVDLIAVGDLDKDGDIDAQDKSLTWDPTIYAAISRAMFRAAQERDVVIRWGGGFKRFFDGPHFELR